MAPTHEVSQYGNRTRYRIKSGGMGIGRRSSPHRYQELEYGDAEKVLYEAPLRTRTETGDWDEMKRKRWESSMKQRQEEEIMKKKEASRAFDSEMKKRLRTLGYDEMAIEEMIGRDKPAPLLSNTKAATVDIYSKVSTDLVDVETLKYFDLPWEYDRSDPAYVIIFRNLDDQERRVLFEHTAKLRSNKLFPEPKRELREFGFVGRGSRSHREHAADPRSSENDEESIVDDRPEGYRRTYTELRSAQSEPAIEAFPIASPTAGDDVLEDDSFKHEDVIFGMDEALDFDIDLPSFKSDDEISDISPDTTSTSHGSSTGLQIGAPLDIVKSKWLGGPLDSWHLRAQLATVSCPPTKTARPTTKWYHLQNKIMNLEEFIAVSMDTLRLKEQDQMLVRSLLLQAQAEQEMPRQHGRQMDPVCIADSDYKEVAGQRRQTVSAIFLSFPVLSLEKETENGISRLTAGVAGHPSRPIVPSRGRPSQAVNSLTTTPDGYSWHTTDLWCLLINSDTLITSSKVSREVLRGSSVSVVTTDHDAANQVLRVQMGEERRWHIPLMDLRSVPSMLSLFTDRITNLDGPLALANLTHRKKSIDFARLAVMIAHSEPSVKVDIDLTLESSISTDGQAVKKEILEHARDDVRKDSTQQAKPEGVTPKFTRFNNWTTLEIFRHSTEGSADGLSRFADNLNQALSQNAQRTLKDAYEVCPEGSSKDVETWLGKYDQWKIGDLSEKANDTLSNKERVAILSRYLFTFFWPLEFDHVLARKFWGALNHLLDGDDFYGQDMLKKPHFASMITDLFFETMYEQLAPLIASLTSILSGLSGHENSLKSSTQPFAKSFLFFMSAFVTAAGLTRGQSWKTPLQYFSMAAAQLSAGERSVTLALRGDLDLDDYEVCSIKGIAALLLDNVSRDLKNDTPFDIAATYYEYHRKLECKIDADPYNRSHQSAIRALQKEVTAISKILAQQLEVIDAFQTNVSEVSSSSSQSPLLPFLAFSSRQDKVFQNITTHLTSRIDAFAHIQSDLTDLSYRNRSEIDTNKDRQEAAIMVFTIVTIIFLPLSFVASVMGMNTNDVRNMDLNQWVFWAAAVPLTVVVVGASMWWAGSFDGWRMRKRDGWEDQDYDSDSAYGLQIGKRIRRPSRVESFDEKPARRQASRARKMDILRPR